MSAKESRAFRKDVRSGLADAERRAYRARIAKLDAELQHVRSEGAKRIKGQRDRCGAEYEEAKRKARTEIERARAERDHKRTSCAIEAEHVKAQAAEERRIAEAKIQAERDHKAEMRRIESGNAERERERKKASAAERRSESDGEVEASLSPRQIKVFRKVKRQIKASDRMSRTEAFLQLVHDAGGLAALEVELGLEGAASDDEYAREFERHHTSGRRASSRVPF